MHSKSRYAMTLLSCLAIFSICATATAKDRAQRVSERKGEWYDKMDFGPALETHAGVGPKTIVLKGIAARLGADEGHTAIFDQEMLSMNAFIEGFLHIKGTPWNGTHGGMPNANTKALYASLIGPGYANPKTGDFKDTRPADFGPLPRSWAKYKGRYVYGDNTVIRYTVGTTDILEMPAVETHKGTKAFTRTFNIAEVKDKLIIRLVNMPGTIAVLPGDPAPPPAPKKKAAPKKKINTKKLSKQEKRRLAKVIPPVETAHAFYVALAGKSNLKLSQPEKGVVLLEVAKGAKNVKFKVLLSEKKPAATEWAVAGDLSKFTKGGPKQWAKTFAVKAEVQPKDDSEPFHSDMIPLPADLTNPWASKIRFSGFDFFADGKRLAICTWNGDVWVASGIEGDLSKITWKRYAAGLFETLGVKIVDDKVYVTGKNQITRLHDLNNDGEADYYENFNNDIMITRNFHEFTFDLQTDKEGNFYFAKGAPVNPGGRGFDVTHAHHGTVFKVSKDGTKSEVHASGLRAPGGLGVGPNGEVTTGENEGTYVPACKINWASKGSFSGVIHPGNGRKFEQGYDPPLCFMPMTVDNSGGGQIWVPENTWGPLAGQLLHLSYGRSSVYLAMRQEVNGVMQGGVVKLPMWLASSAMRARFNSVDGNMYVSGFRGWQTNAAMESAIHRIQFNPTAFRLPTTMRVTKKGVYITFAKKLYKEVAEDVDSYDIKWWNYVWGPQYGSGHFSVNNPDKSLLENAMKKESKPGGTRGGKVAEASFKGDPVKITKATLQADGKTVFLEVPSIRPVMQMQIHFDIEDAEEETLAGVIYNTIHNLE